MKKAGPAVRIPTKIAADIGVKIVQGRLAPGTILDGEIEASGARRVSRSAYREAIRILTAKGLVHSRSKIGTRVTGLDQWHLLDPDVLSWMFVKEPPRTLLVSLFELRKLVEPEAAALAAQRRTLEKLNRMGSALEVMARETLHTQSGRAADKAFHGTLLAASANPFLMSLSSSVTAAVAWSTDFKERTQIRPPKARGKWIRACWPDIFLGGSGLMPDMVNGMRGGRRSGSRPLTSMRIGSPSMRS